MSHAMTNAGAGKPSFTSICKLGCLCAVSEGVPRRSLYVALVVGTVENGRRALGPVAIYPDEWNNARLEAVRKARASEATTAVASIELLSGSQCARIFPLRMAF